MNTAAGLVGIATSLKLLFWYILFTKYNKSLVALSEAFHKFK